MRNGPFGCVSVLDSSSCPNRNVAGVRFFYRMSQLYHLTISLRYAIKPLDLAGYVGSLVT